MTGVKVVAMVCVCIVVFRTVCAVAKSTGYYCTGTAKGNLHLKCATTPCKGTSCKTTVDYEDASGPDAVIIDDSARKILVNLEMANISIIHVSIPTTDGPPSIAIIVTRRVEMRVRAKMCLDNKCRTIKDNRVERLQTI